MWGGLTHPQSLRLTELPSFQVENFFQVFKSIRVGKTIWRSAFLDIGYETSIKE